MSEKATKLKHTGKLILENALRFFFTLGFIMAFQFLFGAENVLVGVAISVALTMIPVMDLGVRPVSMAGILMILFIGSALAAQSALFSPWAALPVNFLFVVLIMLLSGEPLPLKPSISFLLCFVFGQSMPVPWTEFPRRLLGVVVGGLVVVAATVVFWKKRGYGKDGRTIKEQLLLCQKNRSYILRMSIGIAAAMLAGMALHLKRPLWISIVVMSLTQLDFQETYERIKHRAVGTVFGAAIFLIVFRLLVPEEYSFLLILILGYISYFTPEYKHKQIVNAINAINASMVLLDTTSAIANRVLCLLGGSAIVLTLWLAQHLCKKTQEHFPIRWVKRQQNSPSQKLAD